MGIVEKFDGIELGALLVVREAFETVKVVDYFLVAAVDGSGLKDLGKEAGRPDWVFTAWLLPRPILRGELYREPYWLFRLWWWLLRWCVPPICLIWMIAA